MNKLTHMATGAVAAGVALRSVDAILPGYDLAKCVFIAGCVIGSVLPDIDSTQSSIANKNITTAAVSTLAEATFGHRGFLHTPVFLLVLAAATYDIFRRFTNAGNKNTAAFAFVVGVSIIIGWLFHLLLDLFNEKGIMLLYPFTTKRFHFPHTTTSNSQGVAIYTAIMWIFILWLYIFPVGLKEYSYWAGHNIAVFLRAIGLI